MNLGALVFGARPLRRISAAPPGVKWRRIRPRRQAPVEARLAETDCEVDTGAGVLRAEAGRHYVVRYADGSRAVVAADIFRRTYEPVGAGLYVKRTDLTLRYFTLPHRVIVETMEGDQTAQAGDWIVEGVTGELWPAPAAKAAEKYEHVQ